MKYRTNEEAEEIVKQDYSKKIIFGLDDFGNNGHLFQTVTIPPKTKQREHWHHKLTEVFYILEGECHIFINAKDYLAKPGDAFICSPGDKHNLWNKSDQPFTLAVFKYDVPEGDDTEWVEEEK